MTCECMASSIIVAGVSSEIDDPPLTTTTDTEPTVVPVHS